MTSRYRIAWTGRVGERLLYDLRIKVFSHFQRLSIDFFSREKAGRLMTRMTSDLDNLTQLLQEGLVQLFVQGLTMVFVTAVLFSMNAGAGGHHAARDRAAHAGRHPLVPRRRPTPRSTRCATASPT